MVPLWFPLTSVLLVPILFFHPISTLLHFSWFILTCHLTPLQPSAGSYVSNTRYVSKRDMRSSCDINVCISTSQHFDFLPWQDDLICLCVYRKLCSWDQMNTSLNSSSQSLPWGRQGMNTHTHTGLQISSHASILEFTYFKFRFGHTHPLIVHTECLHIMWPFINLKSWPSVTIMQ